MRTKLEPDDDLPGTAEHLARQSPAATAPLKARNAVPQFESKPGASKPGLRIVNQLREDA